MSLPYEGTNESGNIFVGEGFTPPEFLDAHNTNLSEQAG